MEPIYTLELFKLLQPIFEKKIKFVWGFGASKQYESIYISKNKAPPLVLQMVNWSPIRH